MCVICLKPEGKTIPEKYLKKMFNSEPHGAGFAVSMGKYVYFRKGFMDYESFIKNFRPWNNEKFTVVVHFRTATAGSVCPELTHPFPLDERDLLSLEGTAEMVLFHNGTFSFREKENLSDTATLAQFLARMKEKYTISTNDLVKMLEFVAGYNKLVLQTSKEIYLIGNFDKKDDLYFSNLYWEIPEFLYGTKYSKKSLWWKNENYYF